MNTTLKQFNVNLLSSIVTFVVSTLITYFITPIIINSISAEAYGFIGLSNNFISYISLITLSISSMTGRFVIINIQRNEIDKANSYFSSSFIANLFILITLLPLVILVILNIERFLKISINILYDVKVLFIYTFAAFFINVLGATFSIAVTAQNKLYLRSLRDLISNIFKILLLFFLFFLIEPNVYYMGVAAFFSNAFALITDFNFTKKLLPNIQVKRNYFKIEIIKELFLSGIWNSITRASQMLLVGFDLLIANIFLGSKDMGTLAVSKTASGFITSFIYILFPLFIPKFIKLYAQNNNTELIEEVKKSNAILNIFACIPISMLVVFSKEFYSLWVPTQNAEQLRILTIIVMFGTMFSLGVTNMYSVFEVTNNIRFNAITLLISGFLNVIIVLLLLKTTNLGIYAISGVSVLLGIIRDTTVLPIHGAKCLKTKWSTFYPNILNAIISIMLTIIISLFVKQFFIITNWIELIKLVIICGFLGLIISLFFNINKIKCFSFFHCR